MEKLNYEKDVQIDETALDVEWLEQAPLALKYALYAARCNSEVRRLTELKKIIKSELIIEATANPKEVIGKDKPTVADVEAFYTCHERYRKITEELLKAQEEAEFAETAKNEICFTRKKALEMLVELHGQQYFAGPQVPRNLTEEREKRRKQADAGVALKMKRKKEEK